MLTSRCLHMSANQANPSQHSTESWDRLCKTHTYFTPNLYAFHTSPISNTLLEHNKKTIENRFRNTPKYLPKPYKIVTKRVQGTPLGASGAREPLFDVLAPQEDAKVEHKGPPKSQKKSKYRTMTGPKMHMKERRAKTAEMYGIEKPWKPPD